MPADSNKMTAKTRISIERERERSPREWSRWDASDMDGQTREGEAFGLKPNQPCDMDKKPEGCFGGKKTS